MYTLKNNERAYLDAGFAAAFGGIPERYFSAPGRTEIGGNHTDHQQGRVLAAAVDMDTRAAVRVNGTDCIRVQSEGYPLCCVSLSDLDPKRMEVNTTAAIVRGIVSRFAQLGCGVRGFDAFITSAVLPGSGLSSSAAFEVLMGTIINVLFFEGRASAPQIAAIGQYAENVYFGKPCGLMDQMVCAAGGLAVIDFFEKDAPAVNAVDFDFSACGHALCIIDTQASHANLTDEYAAVPAEMKAVAAYFGKEVLAQVPEKDFYSAIAHLRTACGDRAVLRAIHFYGENERVPRQAAALEQGDFDAFLQLVRESGRSSWMYLQNVTVSGCKDYQAVALTLALCGKLLNGRGACRVHGGGFAGTVQAFVPFDILDSFQAGMEAVLGQGSCHILTIRPEGGTEMEVR